MQYLSSFARLITALLLTGMLWSCNGSGKNSAPVILLWEMGQNGVEPGIYDSHFTLVNRSGKVLDDNWVIYFSQNPAEVVHDSSSPVTVEQISATHYRMYPSHNYTPLPAEDSLTVSFRCRGGIVKNSNAPEGAYLVMRDKHGRELQPVTITDYPDLHHRGQMIDVARNFTSKEDMLGLIDLLASYKLNVLHLHLTDDEGWRLEIPGLEELTTVGARRGHTLDEADRLYPAYGSGWDADDPASPGNGYYSRSDFIEILRYAGERHMKVIPEVDMPGHSRAAIKAMNARYHKYIDSDSVKAKEYLLTDFNDRSEYLSAQSYTDNVINVALPSAYRFVQKVVDEIAAMYEEAGMELSIFHIGGDEVPHGAWTESEIVEGFMQEQGMTEIREMKDYFVEQVSGILRDKGLQMAAWQEVALLPDETPNPRFADDNVLSYCWNTIPDWGSDEITYRLADEGFPVILCNVNNLYFDLSYSNHPDEQGAYWGGFVNEYNAFNMLPWDIYKSVRHDMSGNPIDIIAASAAKLPLTAEGMKNVKGMQGQLWAETIRHFGMVEYSLFPKVTGLAERAWNSRPEWTEDPCGETYLEAVRRFNAKVVQHEMPFLASRGVQFRVPQPGILIEEGMLRLNAPIPGAAVRYTLDGSEPDEESTLWSVPVPCNATVVKARLFYMGRESVTTRYLPRE